MEGSIAIWALEPKQCRNADDYDDGLLDSQDELCSVELVSYNKLHCC
jgi:hypothetical protein